MATHAELQHRHAYHPPADDRARHAHEDVRAATCDLATRLNDALPESREKSLALTAVQEAMLWANASIALHGVPDKE